MDPVVPPDRQQTQVPQECVIKVLEAVDRVESHKHIESFLPIVRLEHLLRGGKSVEKLSRTVGVTNVRDLVLTRFLPDKVNEGWHIIEALLCPRKVPVVLVFHRVQLHVLAAERGAPAVAKPHVVAISRQLEGRCQFGVIYNPYDR